MDSPVCGHADHALAVSEPALARAQHAIEVGSVEERVFECRPQEVCELQIAAGQVGARQVSAGQVGAEEITARQVCALELCAAEVRPTKQVQSERTEQEFPLFSILFVLVSQQPDEIRGNCRIRYQLILPVDS